MGFRRYVKYGSKELVPLEGAELEATKPVAVVPIVPTTVAAPVVVPIVVPAAASVSKP